MGLINKRISGWPLGVLVLVLVAGCESSTPSSEAAASTDVVTTGSDGQMTVDMDAIFPQGPGRDLLLNNCQSCHTWVPIVVLQMQEDEWARWAVEHRGRVPGLSDEEFETLQGYLVANFNPDRPVPDLPPALLESWTTY